GGGYLHGDRGLDLTDLERKWACWRRDKIVLPRRPELKGATAAALYPLALHGKCVSGALYAPVQLDCDREILTCARVGRTKCNLHRHRHGLRRHDPRKASAHQNG